MTRYTKLTSSTIAKVTRAYNRKKLSGKYTRKQARDIALGSVRAECRRLGQKPSDIDSSMAIEILDDMSRINPSFIFAIWYISATDAELKKFRHEWNESQS